MARYSVLLALLWAAAPAAAGVSAGEAGHRASSDNEVMSFAGAIGYQYAVAVSADGQTLLAAGSDGILRVWTGREPRVNHALAP